MKIKNNTFKKILFTIITVATVIASTQFNSLSVKAQNTQGSQDETLNQILDQIDDDRIKNLELQLLLGLPLTTENPNYIVSFTDPSPTQKGVFLQIDGKEYKQIVNPYTLPTLGIGLHTLDFRFYDKVDTQQILERNLVIIPRAPQIKPPSINGGNVTVTGTSIATSQAEILVFNDSTKVSLFANADTSGNWSVNLDKPLDNGIYTIFAITRKNGYSSKFSDPLGFEIGTQDSQTVVTPTNDTKQIKFQFGLLSMSNIQDTIKKNPDLAYLVAGAFLLGLILAILMSSLSRNKESKKAEKLLKTVFLPKQNISNENGSKQNVRQILQEKLTKTTVTEKGENSSSKVTETTEKETKLEKEVEVLKEEVDEMIKESKDKKEIKEKKADTTTTEDSKKPTEDEKSEENATEGMENKVLHSEVSEDEAEKEREKAKAIEDFEKEVASVNKELSKADFLMKFKDLDPDDDKGSEEKKDSDQKSKDEKSAAALANLKKSNRNIKISLTSKD